MIKSSKTIRPLSKNLCIFHQRIGCMGQLDHLRKISGKLSGTIRPLSKNLYIFHQRAGCLEQLDHLQKIFTFFTKRQIA
jgi:hypothetical protein